MSEPSGPPESPTDEPERLLRRGGAAALLLAAASLDKPTEASRARLLASLAPGSSLVAAAASSKITLTKAALTRWLLLSALAGGIGGAGAMALVINWRAPSSLSFAPMAPAPSPPLASAGPAGGGNADSGPADSRPAGSGNAESRPAGSGNAASGNAASGNAASGNAASGNAASGNAASGNAASGNAASGNAGKGLATSGTASEPEAAFPWAGRVAERHSVPPDARDLPESAVPAAASASARPPASAAPGAGLAEEVALLDRARRAIRAGDAAGALALLDGYRTSFPRGLLAPEASVLRIDALMATGQRARAQAESRSFLQKFPGSPHAVRLRGQLDSPENGHP